MGQHPSKLKEMKMRPVDEQHLSFWSEGRNLNQQTSIEFYWLVFTELHSLGQLGSKWTPTGTLVCICQGTYIRVNSWPYASYQCDFCIIPRWVGGSFQSTEKKKRSPSSWHKAEGPWSGVDGLGYGCCTKAPDKNNALKKKKNSAFSVQKEATLLPTQSGKDTIQNTHSCHALVFQAGKVLVEVDFCRWNRDSSWEQGINGARCEGTLESKTDHIKIRDHWVSH